jgi:hypothetical protein
VLSNEHSSSTTNEDAIKRYHSLLRKFAETVEAIESNLSYKKQVLNQSFTQEDVLMYKSCSWYRNCMCFWNDFYMVTSDIGYDYILKNIEDSRTLKEKIVKFTCVKEDYLVYNFLMKTAENRVLMSATLGGKEAYAENIGTKYIEENFVDDEEEILFKKIPSTFDFEKSPVYFLNRYKMSNDLDLNFIFFDNYGISKTQKKMKRSDIMKFEELKELLIERKLAEVKKIYQEMNEYDIASLIEELPDELLVKAYRLLPKDKAVDVFVNLDEEVQRDLIAKLSKRKPL